MDFSLDQKLKRLSFWPHRSVFLFFDRHLVASLPTLGIKALLFMPKYPRFETMSISTQLAPRDTGGVPFQCPMLTPSNYTTWEIKMEAIMDAQGVWEAVEPAVGVAVDEKKNKTARAFIFQAVPEDILLQIAKKKKAQEVWETLKIRYIGVDRVQKASLQTLKSEFEVLRMKEGETADEFAGKLSVLVTKFNSLGSTIEDATLVKKLLDSVPDKFFQLVASIEQYSDLDTMPFDEAIGRLKAYEERIRTRSTNADNNGQLLLNQTDWQGKKRVGNAESSVNGRGRGSPGYFGAEARGRGRGRGCGRGNIRGRGGRGAFSTPRRDATSSSEDKSHIKCFNCDTYGHYASECPNPKRRDDEINLTRTQEDEPALMMAVCAQGKPEMVLLNENKVLPKRYASDPKEHNDIWYLDNGASNHMTGKRSHFAELDEKIVGRVKFGDGSSVEIKGKVSVLLECKNGHRRRVQGVTIQRFSMDVR